MPRPCQRRSRHHRSLLIGLALLSPVHAADYLAGLPPPQPAPSGGSNVLYYLELVINGRDSGQVVPVNAADGHYLLDAAALREAGVRLPGNPAGQVAVDALPEVRADYDSASQQLHLQVPPDWLPEQRFDDPGLVARAPARSSLGALFNYDLYYSDPADGATPWLSALLEQRLFDGFGVISNTGVYTRYFGDADNLDSRYLRYDTYWLYNDERNMHSYQLGDYVNGALNWTTPVRMGGFRFARNFGVRPDLVTYPLLRFDGQAAVPSTVDLFINGYKASSADLQPGPFAISNVPYINGAGEATVVTTDAQGRQVVTSLPFYVSNTLLARGLSDFDLSVGRLRDEYGLRNFSYADNAASGIYRYGVSDRLTLSTHAEAASDLRLLGIGGDIAVATFGTLSLAASGSDGQGDSGQQYLLGYSYYSRRLGLSLQHIERSAGYGDLGTLDGEYQLSRRTDQATASLTFDEQGTIGTGYFDIRARDGSRTRLANLSYSRPIGSRSSFYLALNKDLDGDGYSALMQLVIPFDINGLLNIGVTRDSDRRYSERVIWSRSTPSQGGLGWNLGYGGGASRYQQADLTWRMQNVQLQGGLYGETGNYTRWADLSGSLVWMDNAVFASNRINDAFVLVSTKGYPQVPIRYENQLMGSTDDNGHLLVPWVAAYYPAKFQIEPLDLPANVSAPEVEQRVAVRQGSGLLLDFPIRAVVAASISLVDERGEPLPLGSQAEETGSGQRASVGWDGQVYFEGLQSDNQLRVVRPDGRACQARFRLDTRKPTVSQVGPLTCSAPIGDTP
ncbi:TPA: fimbrial biogenesis outer membrane usher protein [Pseudomonas aeruginosa]|uniref:fimbria/pilus outer membrane usher protein n=1 Tax=Pseudomonas aeruginosa TaxID=287 RepID=UPI00376CC969|nr:fimbrial biogenesis outer membrane usher protein [Pseudomonas aeruginosa]HBO2642232.1 fimbrial biogenesis outer membrane usher protein [Pseudomonas aeruginosa]HCF6263679.1 fimbrial biogenesis outer membrane usher protein [Pseudomonas aeruginosa]